MMFRYSSFFRNSSSKIVTLAVDINSCCGNDSLSRFRSGFEDFFDDPVGIDPFGLAFEVQQNAVPQCTISDGSDIVAGDVHAIIEECPDLAANNERLRATGTGSISHVLHCQRRRIWWLRMRRQGYTDCVVLHR